jgi:hypothetical protein
MTDKKRKPARPETEGETPQAEEEATAPEEDTADERAGAESPADEPSREQLEALRERLQRKFH